MRRGHDAIGRFALALNRNVHFNEKKNKNLRTGGTL
jgi:hypothetical protein